ncbi:T9SS type A sorting domain-containing protein [Flavobacterium sp. NST-5]|uniref:T9SS type A sorting domain-containing protein n=1 Tax=Flavobacterium ichthyis TaxID=2698827 RepID=A0ABW9Z6F6_9FLAO|nr:T9SS type A sorting domain-containing protein [Flavobacterium ichthyis]NBL64276.1 T9SS type A sorting domain-containing protein [Flavobacterium ichthyis]
MKQKLLLLITMLYSSWVSTAQVLNQSAGWPNAAWTITGTYNTDPLAFESDPTTTAFFAFDDDDAGQTSDDDIAAESPIIDLTPAFTAGETALEISVDYGYYFLDEDVLRFEYWDVTSASWMPWESGNLPGNSTSVFDNFCTIPKTNYVTQPLSIANFTPAQLAGFRYRIFYDDDPAGADWNYGFCFASPTIRSLSCAAPANLAVVANSITNTNVNIEWTAVTGITGFEYVLDNVSTDPTGAGTSITSNTYSRTDLMPSTQYYFHLRTVCTSGLSPWRTITFSTLASPPANDDCAAAISLSPNADLLCGSVVAGTLAGATDSGESDNGAGTPDDDVWYTFVATASTHRISLLNVTGTPTDLVHEVLEGTCGGGLISLIVSDANTSNVSGLVVGSTYYVRVFTFTSGSTNTTNFDICVGTFPPPPANDDCTGALVFLSNNDGTCTNSVSGALTSATDSGEGDNGAGTPNDDVWFQFVATATEHKVLLTNVQSTPTDLVHEVLEGTCGGGLVSLLVSDPNSSIVSGLTIGNSYFVRVFSNSANSGATTTFDLCVSTPPVGSVCQNPIVVSSLPYTTTDNTSAYGNDYSYPLGGLSGCAATSNYYLNGDDVVYAYTPSSDQSINIRIPNAVAWSGMLVYTDCSAIGTGAVACASGSSVGNREINDFSVTAGVTYYIVISTWPSPDNFAYTLNITQNTCVNPTVTFSTTNNCATSPDFFVNANVTDLGSATSLTLSDDQSSPTQNITATGSVQFGPYPVGTNVVITVTNDQDGNCVVTSTSQTVVACPPANDVCANAIPLTPGALISSNPLVGSNLGATNDSSEPLPTCDAFDFANSGKDVWYSVVVPASGELTVETATVAGTTMTDSGVEVYSGTCGAITSVLCNADDGDGNFSKVVMTGLTPASTLLVRVWGYNGQSGQFQISAYDASLSNEKFDFSSFKAYPNPVKDILNLSFTENITEAAVFNLLGQQVLDKKLNTNNAQLDMSQLPQGTYLVKLNIDGALKTIKVIKE